VAGYFAVLALFCFGFFGVLAFLSTTQSPRTFWPSSAASILARSTRASSITARAIAARHGDV